MNTWLDAAAISYIDGCQEELCALLAELCAIPAPSGREERRARFVKDWLESAGAEGVYIDEALNVVYPVGVTEHGRASVFMAHTDTVFPDMEPMPLSVKDGVMYCPGVGDDTANLAVLMLIARYVTQRGLAPRTGVLFVANSCEEGLGNLKGCRAVMARYGARVDAFVSLDSTIHSLCNLAVGSARYRVTVRTEGGHSFSSFGNRNAIHALSEIVCALYGQTLPEGPEGSVTTYNVGVVEGGTSVNTIAQEASMLYEYRSNARECLAAMKASFERVIDGFRARGLDVSVEMIGERPCMGDVDPARQRELTERCLDAIEHATGRRVPTGAASTDCNIPLSMGIPAACFGVYEGGGAHTREEWVRLSSLRTGMRAAMEVVLSCFS